MNARKVMIISLAVMVLAMVLIISSRVGNTYKNATRFFGIDVLLFGATLILLVIVVFVIYILYIHD